MAPNVSPRQRQKVLSPGRDAALAMPMAPTGAPIGIGQGRLAAFVSVLSPTHRNSTRWPGGPSGSMSKATSSRQGRWPPRRPRRSDHVQALLMLGHVLGELGAFERPLRQARHPCDQARAHPQRRQAPQPRARTSRAGGRGRNAQAQRRTDRPAVRPACRRSTPRFGISRLKFETASTRRLRLDRAGVRRLHQQW
jgi:hypothetical protein